MAIEAPVFLPGKTALADYSAKRYYLCKTDGTVPQVALCSATTDIPIGVIYSEPTAQGQGIDVAAPTGRPITAAKSGTVILAGWSGGYGNMVVIDHGGGLSTAYAHQSRIAVKVGDPVTQGALIGFIGSTGHSTGPHLHFEVRVNGAARDPLPYL
jgi:murein DD-endopeptidase MepM/ murein hydrolase activator NlpD